MKGFSVFSFSVLFVFTNWNGISASEFRLPHPYDISTYAPTSLVRMLNTGVDDYRIGDEWGKKAITSDDLIGATPAFRRAVMATARAGGATGFFLGEFNGYLVMATNHHVFPSEAGCKMAQIRFPLLGVEVSCGKYFGTWTDIDLTLFAVNLKDPSQKQRLLEVAGNFAFQSDIIPEQELITAGFGIAGNSRRDLVANQDSDCKVFSQKNDFRFMGDPDEFNPGTYKAWSFANGCDVSHGDSGSAMVDRQTGEVVGIIWTGRIPKNPKIQSSAYLAQMLVQQSDEVWTELSFAVPAAKIGEHIQKVVDSGKLDSETRTTLMAVLAR